MRCCARQLHETPDASVLSSAFERRNFRVSGPDFGASNTAAATPSAAPIPKYVNSFVLMYLIPLQVDGHVKDHSIWGQPPIAVHFDGMALDLHSNGG